MRVVKRGTTAILDRFLHHAEIIQITGKSYRLRQAGRSDKEAEEESKPASANGGAHDSKQATRPEGAQPSK